MAVSRGSIAVVTAVVVSACLQMIESKWIEGTLITNSDWTFLTRFCFLNQQGKLDYFLEYPVDHGVESMLFYYDTPGQWDSVYQTDKTCKEKVEIVDADNVFPLLEQDSMCVRESRLGQDWYVCSGEIAFRSARERWWYVVLSKCNASDNFMTSSMYLHYKIHMTNGDDFLHKEYSADELYIVLIDIVFLGLHLALLLASVICAVIMKAKRQLHATYKMYLLSLVIWTLSLLCLAVAWLHYGITGWKIGILDTIGRILQMCSNVVFILLLILIAKGYTVVRYNLSRSAVFAITVFMILYITAMVVMFVWENILFDPGLVLDHYQSPPGYGMLTVVLIGWLWFCVSAVFTLKHHTSRAKFYVIFCVVYTIWFWAEPIVVLTAIFVMDKWAREKTVTGVQQAIQFTGYLFFLVLTLPYRDNSNFPYRTRMAQAHSGNGRNKQYSCDDRSDVINQRDTFPTKGSNLDIAAKSKSMAADDDNLDLMLNIPLKSSSLSDGTISPDSSQKTDPYTMSLSFDNDSSDTDTTSIGDNNLLQRDSPAHLATTSLSPIDEHHGHV